MALIQTQPDLTIKANRVALAKATITAMINNHFNAQLANYQNTIKGVFFNQTFSAQDVCDSFGTDAGALINILNAVKNLLNTMQPNSASDLPALTINNDGTVTIT